jgi:carboxyl-terminal processing protease
MTARTRFWVLAISTPIIAFALVGGYLGQAMERDEPYKHLRIFDDVVSLVEDNYVEEVDMRQAMRGAIRGLADSLDPDSAFLTADLVRTFESNNSPGPADVGVELIRQYYLRVVSARDGSPGAKAGLRTGDFVRAIDGRPTRDMSAFEGARLLRGAAGSKVVLLVIRGNAAEPHEMTLVRERATAPEITTRMAGTGVGYIRVAEFTEASPARLREAVDALAKMGATRYAIDLRGTARGDLDHGVAAARLFVKSGTLAVRQSKAGKETVAAAAAPEGVVDAPLVLLVNQGTAGAAELFASALDGNDRAELIGDRTLGRAARQQLVKLPDGSGLLLSSVRYLTPKSAELHEKGLTPDLEVDEPIVEFGAEVPPGDPVLDKALERLADRKAA